MNVTFGLMIKMNLRLYIICTLAIISLIGPALAGSAAMIHGAVYKWDSFEPLDNSVIEVNSTPVQYMVAKNGRYSIGLVPGNFTITARYYQNGILTYSTEEIIEIEEGGDYVFDLLLSPVYSKELIEGAKVNTFSEEINESAKNSSQNEPKTESIFSFSNLTSDSGTSATKQSELYFSIIYYLLIALMCFVLLVEMYRILKKHRYLERNAFHKVKNGHIIKHLLDSLSVPQFLVKPLATTAESKEEYSARVIGLMKTEIVGLRQEEGNRKISLEEAVCNSEVEIPALKKKLVLSGDLQEVLDVIRSQGGQISQKDLRSRLKYSEVKVSLMLANLEKRKIIKKFKRGRENIVFLIDSKR